TQASIDDARIRSNLAAQGFPNASIADHNRDTGYKVFGGYQFNRHWALEGSYFDLGSYRFDARTTPPGTLGGEVRLRGLALDAVLSAPLTDKFSVFGKLGANYAEARDSFSSSGVVSVANKSPSQMELNPKIGIGMQYAFSDALAVRAELERYRVNDAVGSRGDVDHLSVGLVYSWGQARKPVVVARPAPEPVPVVEAAPVPLVAEPLPEPVAQPKAVVVVVPTKVTLSADSLFAFDKATLSGAGKQEIDAFAAGLSGLDYEVLTVTGHTDRLGSEVYNLKLSERRAQVVGNYLVQAKGIPEGKLLARGQSGANAVTQPADCVGSKPTPALIACLQPDRRVDLEVTGTR
ncbi:MAG: OmpA family protein, partial [Rhodoferax sp.]|nr:OmpA family protein [Rhodoferax sp.]